jgi:hypothetical protein
MAIMKIARLISFIASTLLFSALPASAATVQFSIEGLPSGLKVSERGEFHKCPPTTSQIPIDAGGVILQEHTIFTIEQNPGPGPFSPAASFVIVPRSVYTGEITVHPPTNTGCVAIEDQRLSLFVEVLGEGTNGHQGLRQGDGGTAFVENDLVTVQAGLKAHASTDSLVELGTHATPTTLAKNTLHRLLVQYSDTFFATSIRGPSIDFTQQALAFGHLTLVSRARATLTNDNQVCLLVANENKCAPLTQNTALSNGAVTIAPSDILVSSTLNSTTVIWPIQLNQAFASGNFTLIATASDLDPFSYIVNGVPQPIQLLPWKALRLPITVP